MQNKTVLEVVADRQFARNSGVEYHDDYKLCLAVEGGAMRGIVSCGMLLALNDLNLLDIFDDYVGVSAGSLNLAYTLAGQGPLGLSIYFDDMPDKEIVDILRFRSEEHPVMDIVKLYMRVKDDKRLNTEVLKTTFGDSFHVSVTNVTKNRGELITLRHAGHRFEEFLVSGALVPFIAGDPWIINNDHYYDGGLWYIDPVLCAKELKSTHALVLNTYTQDQPTKRWGRLVERKFKSLDERYPEAGTHYIDALNAYCDEFTTKPFGEALLGDMHIYRHALAKDSGVHRLTMDTEKLIKGLKEGYESIVAIFYSQGRVGIIPTLM